jgi:hypothetical protein
MKGKCVIMATTSVVDPTFGINDFNQPKVLSETETVARNILLLLFGKPGFYPSMPDIGMDIGQYLYGFEDEINTEEIKSELADQCSEFLPEVTTGEFDIIKTTHNDQPLLIIKIPVIIDNKTIAMALGITINTKGELIYNFIENKQQLL